MRFVKSSEHHGVIHYLITIIIRIIYFAIFGPLGIYTTAIGFIFFSRTLEAFLPQKFFMSIKDFYYQLPYFFPIRNFLIVNLGYWYQNAKSFWAIVAGFPLIIIGINIFMISLSTLILVIVNSFYNRSRCPICKKPVEIKNGKAWKS